MILDTATTEKSLEAIGLPLSKSKSLKVFLSHRTTECNTDGIAEYTLWVKDEEVGTCFQVIKFLHHSYDEARLIAGRYKGMLLEGVAKGYADYIGNKTD